MQVEVQQVYPEDRQVQAGELEEMVFADMRPPEVRDKVATGLFPPAVVQV
jgi:hypothetical protein